MNVFSHKELTQEDIDLYFFYRKEGITEGFFKRYFAHLPKSPTFTEAFNQANEEYFTLFSEYRYSCYGSFRNQLTKHGKTDNK